MNQNDTIKRAFCEVTGLNDFDGFKIEHILDGVESLPENFEETTIYGFNVRLQKNDPVTPILGGKQKEREKRGKSVQEIFKNINSDLTILKVFENCSDREVFFSYTGGQEINLGKVELTLKDRENKPSIINQLKNEKSFLGIQKIELFPDDPTMYYWISRENEEKIAGNSQQQLFLSNILVISSDKSNLDFVKQHKIHFLRFLLKLQAAFSLILSEKVETTAVRASIAQVMARNMSHNIGSHVLSNLIKADVYDELTDERIEKLDSYCSNEMVVFHHTESQLKNLQLGYFNQYLKSRMDYLSEVTFGVPTLLTSKMIYNDVFKELDQVRILLNYISGVNDFKYRFDFQRNGNSIMEDPERDFAVAFPSDVLGCQAFYNIIENIIRNTAKHAKKQSGEPVTFTINFKDIKIKGDLKGIDGIEDLYCVEIDNGVGENRIGGIVNEQNDRLNESVLDEKTQQLRSQSLGLLEMEASAAFLRQIDMPEIESEDYHVDIDGKYYHERNAKKRLNILKAIKVSRRDGQGRTTKSLGYRFFVQKPKEFLFVGKWDLDKTKEKRLRNYGIHFISADDFNEALNNEKSFSHQFLLYTADVPNKVKKKLGGQKESNTLLPLRQLKIDKEEKAKVTKLLKQKNNVLLAVKDFVWEKYFNEKVELTNSNVKEICFTPQFFSDPKMNQVVFLDHGYEGGHKEDWKTAREHKDFEAWVENLSSRTYGKLPEYGLYSKNEDTKKSCVNNYCDNLLFAFEDEKQKERQTVRWILQEVLEAYHNRVVVLDERIQKFAVENAEGSGNKGEKIPCWKLFQSTNVHVPLLSGKDCNGNEIKPNNDTVFPINEGDVFSLAPDNFDDELIKKVETFVNNNIDNAFLMVHYGILERMYGGENKISSKLIEWASKAKRVVVTSGRGAHSLLLPPSVCFVNLSSALFAFTENRNKYLINYLLNQSRRK